jgi:flagellar biogenesis protein FliO
MFRLKRIAALAVSAAIVAAPLQAENTPAPPDWQDAHGPSVYTQLRPPGSPLTEASQDSRYAPTSSPGTFSAPPNARPLTTKPDAIVTQLQHEEIASADPPGRHLAPPSAHDEGPGAAEAHASSSTRRLAGFGMPLQSIYTVVTALAIVLGAFLLFAWAIRRGGKNSVARRGGLPSEVVNVLGRVPLAARQFAQLLRVGNKLVLVALTPDGPTTLTEVTDPAEVDRLVGLCQQSDSKSSTKTFEHVFQQFTNEPVSGGFLGSETLPTSLTSAASAYRSHRGTARA